MMKPTVYELKGSNVENIGGEEDKAARQAAGMTEVEWEGAGQQPGLEIWRVENKQGAFGIKRIPKEVYGSFFRGDSYICMHTKEKSDGGGFDWDIYFWIGTQSTADEYGVAAYKAVELDDLLGGGPIQHREIEGYETDEFLALFSPKGPCPGGIRYMEGGIESGFRHVKPEEYKPRLLHVRRENGSTMATEVELAFASLNVGDSFVLDSGTKIFVFRGDESDGFEKLKANEMAKHIESERAGKAKVLDANDDTEFYSILGGGDADKVAPAGARAVMRTKSGSSEGGVKIELYSMDDDTRTFVKVCDGPLSTSQLRDDDVMMVIGNGEVFVAVGEAAPREEKACSMFQAQKFITERGMHPRTPITRLITGPMTQFNPKWQACFA